MPQHVPCAQSCLTLRPHGLQPPDSSVSGIFQATVLEYVAISSSRGSSPPRDQTQVSCVSCIASRLFTSESLEKPICVYTYQFSLVAQSFPTLCDPMNCSTSGLPVHHQLPEFTQTHVHRVGDAIQPPHPLSSPFPPAPNPSQHQSLFQ